MNKIVNIDSHTQNNEAIELFDIPMVNCEMAVDMDNQMDVFIKPERLSSGLYNNFSSISSLWMPAILAYISL